MPAVATATSATTEPVIEAIDRLVAAAADLLTVLETELVTVTVIVVLRVVETGHEIDRGQRTEIMIVAVTAVGIERGSMTITVPSAPDYLAHPCAEHRALVAQEAARALLGDVIVTALALVLDVARPRLLWISIATFHLPVIEANHHGDVCDPQSETETNEDEELISTGTSLCLNYLNETRTKSRVRLQRNHPTSAPKKTRKRKRKSPKKWMSAGPVDRVRSGGEVLVVAEVAADGEAQAGAEAPFDAEALAGAGVAAEEEVAVDEGARVVVAVAVGEGTGADRTLYTLYAARKQG